MNLRRIEEASLNAWPALQQALYDGWLLRFSGGYTKRANSVNPLYPSLLDLGDNIRSCEREYAARGLPPIFRLTPFAPAGLDPLLARRGYRVLDPTLVLRRQLAGFRCADLADGSLAELAPDEWLAEFHRLKGTASNPAHRAMLQAIPAVCFRAALMVAGGVATCGLGVLEDGLLGVFDLVTDPEQRRQGHGTRVVGGLLAWALGLGGHEAYLQVMESNEPARRIYAKLGFEEAYRYWYRVQ